jgi:hypothetical protein
MQQAVGSFFWPATQLKAADYAILKLEFVYTGTAPALVGVFPNHDLEDKSYVYYSGFLFGDLGRSGSSWI